MSWPADSQFAPAPPPRGRTRVRLSGFAGVTLVIIGVGVIAAAVLAQQFAPSPSPSAAGAVGAKAKGPSLGRSVPVSVSIPEIGVRSKLLSLGLNPDGSIEVPSLATSADEAAWYKYSVTPGQVGAAVIEGHVDSYSGPAVFFRLGELKPGDLVDVDLADHKVTVFKVTAVRLYQKSQFPTAAVYGFTDYPSLRLVTCGGGFDGRSGQYNANVVVFASLVSVHPS